MYFTNEVKTKLMNFCSMRYKKQSAFKKKNQQAKIIYVPDTPQLMKIINNLLPYISMESFTYKNDKERILSSNSLLSSFVFSLLLLNITEKNDL